MSTTPQEMIGSTHPLAPGVQRRLSPRRIGFILVLLGTLGCLYSSFRMHGTYLFGADFRALYSSSRCMAVGCDPYRGAAIKQQFLAHGGKLFEVGVAPESPFTDNYLDYPPMSMFYLMPFALLPWRIAWYSWLAISMMVYTVAALEISKHCSIYSPVAANLLLACFVMMVDIAFVLANPALLASGLCCLSVLLLLNDRRPGLSVAMFTLSLLLKPHLGAFVLLYFLVAGVRYRKRALQIIAACIACSIPALLWVSVRQSSHNWLKELSGNLAGVSSRGQMSDPGPSNHWVQGIVDLRTALAFIHDDPAFYSHVTIAISICFLALWLYPAVKLRPSRQKDWIALAAIACFSLLPVYHRNSDTKLLLLAYPAIAILIQRTRWVGIVAGAVGFFLAIISGRFFIMHDRRFPAVAIILRKTVYRLMPQVVLDRPEPVLFLLSAVFFVVVLYAMLWSDRVSPAATALAADSAPCGSSLPTAS